MIAWEEWEAKPVRVRMVRFTGFGPTGNGWALLKDLEDRGVLVDKLDETLRIRTRARESVTFLGDWIVIGTRDEVYPIEPPVQGDKYRRPTS
jgi:hypothetical protein